MRLYLLFLICIWTSNQISAQTKTLNDIIDNKKFDKFILGKKMPLDTSFTIQEVYKTSEKKALKEYWYRHDGSVYNLFYNIPVQSITITTKTNRKITQIGIWFANNYSREKNDENLECLLELFGPPKQIHEVKTLSEKNKYLKWFRNSVSVQAHYFDSSVNKSGMLSISIYRSNRKGLVKGKQTD